MFPRSNNTITEPAPKSTFGLNSVFCINGEPSLHLVGNFKSAKETGFTLIYKIQYECTARTRFTSASSGKKNIDNNSHFTNTI